MDIQKDSPREEGIAKFVDKQAVKTNPFGDNRVGERAYRRAERLSSAIFLLTNHVPETEPLKQVSRREAIELLSGVLELKDEMRALNSERAQHFKATIRKLISIVRLLAIAGFVSFQNADSVCDALDDLASFLSASQRSTLSESVSFSREDLLEMRESISDRKASDRGIREVPQVSERKPEQQRGSLVVQKLSEGTSSRASAILEVLRVSGELGIRDVASNLPEYSEKMIQRELAALVSAGKVKKSGLKRWSRYTLV